MSDLGGAIDLVLQRISKHGAASFNEENTAVVLIEPVLAALGWDLSDLGSVDRQYRVYDGTKLDYALKLDGKSTLFVEVKGLEQSLDDPKFIAQTVNYANNEGVLWCVLTNALVYRIYKTNEPVAMADKLMVEIDIRNTTDDPSRVATLANLELLSQSSLANGKLTSTAELVFTGGVVGRPLSCFWPTPRPSSGPSSSRLLDTRSIGTSSTAFSAISRCCSGPSTPNQSRRSLLLNRLLR